MKLAFITAIYGGYEQSCKSFVKQSVDCDFICFTNDKNIKSNGWIIDVTPYHLINKSRIDTDQLHNSIVKNKHTFNIAKYYKQNFHNIPRLTSYDIIIWLDGTIEIINPDFASWIIEKINKNDIVTIEHIRSAKDKLHQEALESQFDRYTSTFWFNQSQPYQDVIAHYKHYIDNHYDDSKWSQIVPNRPNYGLFVTCFVAFNMKKQEIINFLDEWYLQTLTFTTQDQISFPYVLQKKNIIPYTVNMEHDRASFNYNIYFKKHCHGI